MNGDNLATIAIANELTGREVEKLQGARVEGLLEDAGSARRADVDPDVAMAADLQALLEQTARGHGFHSFVEMERRLIAEREELDPENRYQLLKGLAPALHEVDEYGKRRTLPEIDASGLVAIQDLTKSVARLIRVLLLGYSPEEQEELAGRMKAERAIDADSAMGQSSGETDHQASLEWMGAMARGFSRDPKVGP
jgi:hypothetical protein